MLAFGSQFSCSTCGRLQSDGTVLWLVILFFGTDACARSGESDGMAVFSCLDASFQSCSGRGVDFFSVILFV